MVHVASVYRGRLAPSPTGYLHIGHARTFWTAQERARAAGGTLILRNDDLDSDRSRAEYVAAMIEDLRWLGLDWQEGPNIGGSYAPYNQSERQTLYRASFAQLRAAGLIYPCTCSRKDVATAISAPHESHSPNIIIDEPAYPGTCRPENLTSEERVRRATWPREKHNWRLCVTEWENMSFTDGCCGEQHAMTGRERGDFLVWRKDDQPSYQLACTIDDAAMKITEVVRGADLLLSTFRQLLLYRAFGWPIPAFYHCPLMLNKYGIRLAKRYDSLSSSAPCALKAALRKRLGMAVTYRLRAYPLINLTDITPFESK